MENMPSLKLLTLSNLFPNKVQDVSARRQMQFLSSILEEIDVVSAPADEF